MNNTENEKAALKKLLAHIERATEQALQEIDILSRLEKTIGKKYTQEEIDGVVAEFSTLTRFSYDNDSVIPFVKSLLENATAQEVALLQARASFALFVTDVETAIRTLTTDEELQKNIATLVTRDQS